MQQFLRSTGKGFVSSIRDLLGVSFSLFVQFRLESDGAFETIEHLRELFQLDQFNSQKKRCSFSLFSVKNAKIVQLFNLNS